VAVLGSENGWANDGLSCRRIEIGRAVAKVGFLERGSGSPPHQLGGLGSAVRSPNVVPGDAPTEVGFGEI